MFDPPILTEEVEKSSQNSDSKSNAHNLKSTEYPTDMSGTTESDENIEGM